MTEKLYYKDSHMQEFDAEVCSCTEVKKGYEVVLDRTAFFPEGGGQYADAGYLDDVRVLDAHERDDVVYHLTEKPLEAGSKIHGKIDWQERFTRMQQHSGEHIVSGLVHERFGYDNVGFHLGNEDCTIDFNGIITKEEIKEIEAAANEIIFGNRAIEVTYPSKEALAALEYRSKIEIAGQVRIVTIPGVDVCACCAPHLSYTGEIGLLKIVNMINYKGGVRLTMLCGRRALLDYGQKEENVKAISALLCAKEGEVAQTVEGLYEEQRKQKSRNASLQQKLLAYKAAEVSVKEEVVTLFDGELDGNGPRELMNLVLEQGAKVCAVFAGTDESGYRYVIGSKDQDVRPLGKVLNEKFAGRGGGKQEMVQGSLTGKQEEIEKAL